MSKWAELSLVYWNWIPDQWLIPCMDFWENMWTYGIPFYSYACISVCVCDRRDWRWQHWGTRQHHINLGLPRINSWNSQKSLIISETVTPEIDSSLCWSSWNWKNACSRAAVLQCGASSLTNDILLSSDTSLQKNLKTMKLKSWPDLPPAMFLILTRESHGQCWLKMTICYLNVLNSALC